MVFDLHKKIPTIIALVVVVLATIAVVGFVLRAKNIEISPSLILDLDSTRQEVKTGRVAPEGSTFYRELQDKVDQGDRLWRLDPVQVARNKGEQYGFAKADEFNLKSKQKIQGGNSNLAFVVAEHNNESYIIQLAQPEKIGSDGIWTIQRIEKKLPGVPVEWKKCRGDFFEIRYPLEVNVTNNCGIDYSGLEESYLLRIESQSIPSEVSLEKWIKEKFSVEEVKEFKKNLETKANAVDCIQEAEIGGGIPGYFVHAWGVEGKMGICMYATKSQGRIIKIKGMRKGLDYSTCLNDQTWNQIASSFRLLEESDY